MNLKALIIEDDDVARQLLAGALTNLGLDVEQADSAEAGRPLLGESIHLLFLDLGLPGTSGDAFIYEVEQKHPQIPIIVITADTSVERAVEAMRRGAHDYLTKPVDAAGLEAVVHRARSEARLRGEVYRLRKELTRRDGLPGVIGTSAPMREVYDRIRKAAHSKISVTFMGESGTGKEVLARALHRESPRRAGPFVALNCAAVPRELLESQLFGHRKGAFTGAVDDQLGHFQMADGGTLFLDEIGEMDPALQAKLLRTLQEGTVHPVGAQSEIRVDVRIVAATNRDLSGLVSAQAFREDLYYRIVAFAVDVPPLRRRGDDIPLLAFHFLAKHRADAGRPTIDGIAPEALDALRRYDWPGNVRQLENVMHQALLLSPRDDRITLDALPTEVLAGPADRATYLPSADGDAAPADARPSGFHDPDTGKMLTLREIEDAAFRLALEESGGNTTQAAKALGVARATFYRRLGAKKKASA